jgi:DNA mismatch repair protein MutL
MELKKIRLLPPLVAERIAAGEVIERPSSVVKELVENAIDAGATDIAVHLLDGGKQTIEIIDNGSGMSREDLALCIERHATSKISTLDDLDQLSSLGFRGEALPSIAAAGNLSIISRSENSDSAYEVRRNSSPKAVTFGLFLGSKTGTRVKVDSLFSEIPVRLKFLKSERSEVATIKDWLERLSLIRPETKFSLYSDDRRILELLPVNEMRRVQDVLGVTDNDELKFIESNSTDFKIRAYFLEGQSYPHTRKLIQVINKRALRDRLVQQAILSPFKQSFLPGHFPAMVLFFDVKPSEIDVNVHPTKTEVRFLESNRVFHEIEGTLKGFLNVPKQIASSTETHLDQTIPIDQFQFQQSFTASEPILDTISSRSLPHHQFGEYLGVLFATYFLFQKPALDSNSAEMILIDQHAAHERIRYEQLKNKITQKNTQDAPQSQSLLLPLTVSLKDMELSEIQSLPLSHLKQLGFDMEFFGDRTVIVRAIPALWGNFDLENRIRNLLRLASSVNANETTNGFSKEMIWDKLLFESIASEACRSSIKSGDRVSPWSAHVLASQLMQCEHPWNCPHGRPTIVRFKESKLEEWFQRKV